MEQFLASQMDITYVLSLYPSVVLPNRPVVSHSEDIMDMPDSSDETESSFPSQQIEPNEMSKQKEKKMSHNAYMALIKYLQKKRLSIIEKVMAELTEEVVLDAVHSSNTRRSKNRGSSRISSISRELAIILDTALIQALIFTRQTPAALELLKGPNYCELTISEHLLKQWNSTEVLLELYRCNEMHRKALKFLVQLVEKSDSCPQPSAFTHKFQPDMIIDYLKPICSTDPMLVLEFSTHILESCPNQTIDLFLSGNIPVDLVNSYLKQHAPTMQTRYLELMLSMNNNSVNSNLQNELVQIYLSEVIEWYSDLRDEQKWNEKARSTTREKLLSALDVISCHNAEKLLNHLPQDALYEEHAILLGRMNQHQLALSLYVHKLHMPDLALAYCDRVFNNGLQQPSLKYTPNVYHMLLQVYLYPQRAKKDLEKKTSNSKLSLNSVRQKAATQKTKSSRLSKKIVEIKGADNNKQISPSSTDTTDSGRSDGDVDENVFEGGPVMSSDALDLLRKRWDRMNGSQTLKLLPKEIKLQDLLLFLEPLLKNSSESRRNNSVVKSLRYSENLQVKEELHKQQKPGVTIDNGSTCSLCRKRIGGSVFVIYPNQKTLVHFVCHRDSQKLRL